MYLFKEVFCKVGCMAIAVESPSVFVVTFGEASSGLSYVDLIAIWAGEFVDSR